MHKHKEETKEFVLPQRIAVATDFSIASGLAIGWAITWAKSCHAQLYIAHVIEPAEVQGPTELRSVVRKEVRDEAERQLGCYVDRLHHVAHEFVCLEGEVGESLSDFVAKKGIDLLVVGSRGRRGVRRVMLGSVAETIFHAVTCPVMTVGIDSANYTRPADGVHRVLFPTDFSPDSLSALPYAASLANAHAAQLLLLHVAEPSEEQGPDEPSPEQRHFDALELALAEVPGLKVPPKFVCMKGYPTEAILAAARDNIVDLLVLGIRDQKRLELDGAKPSLSYEIVARAQCPVVTLHNFRKGLSEKLPLGNRLRLVSNRAYVN